MTNALLVSLRPEMLRWLRYKTGAAELAEEVFQQASLRALERLHQLRDPQGFKAWFRQIALNTLLDEWRRQERLRPLDGSPLAAEEPLSPQESCGCVLTLLKSLSTSYAEVLIAVDIQGQAVQDVAQALGVTPNALSVRLYRARKALRLRLNQVCGTDSIAACLNCTCA